MDEVEFGRYRLVELLGRGGMGEVWRAYDTAANNRTVAIKLLPPHLAGDTTFLQRFRREADAAAQLNNPHIIPIHNYGEIDGRLYVDMRLIEGRDLQTVLVDGPLEPSRAVRIIEQVAKALHAAHKVGLVHRDVKPSNILLDDDDFAYLIDFGIARGVDETRLTGTGSVIGSWHYMSPERLRAGQVDARADIYALACVLYECLTGSTPYPGDNFEQQITAHLTEPPPRPSSADPNMPVALDTVIAAGMAKDPEQRYATTVELASAAHDAITTPIPRPVAPTEPDDGDDIVQRADTFENRGTQQSADTVLDYPDTPPPQQIPGPASDPTLLATPHAGHGIPHDTDAWRATQHAGLPLPTPTGEPKPSTTRGPKSRRTKIALAAGAVVLIAVVATVIGVVTSGHQSTQGSQTAPPNTGYGPQPVLAFTGLQNPWGVAVDVSGSVYVADYLNNRVLKSAAGSSTQTALPFTGLDQAGGVAVDSAGSVYVADIVNDRVVVLAAGSSTQTVLPFTGLHVPQGVAVDAAGSVYVADNGTNGRVVKLAVGASTQTVLPFTGLNQPAGVAVDAAGTVYVAEYYRVLKLTAGSSTQTVLPFTGLNRPVGVAVDAAENIYVTDERNNRVLKLAAGATTSTTLPFTGLNGPLGVAVDGAGNVYVADSGHNRVLKLPVS
jgi:serine/threonine-protein kinase